MPLVSSPENVQRNFFLKNSTDPFRNGTGPDAKSANSGPEPGPILNGPGPGPVRDRNGTVWKNQDPCCSALFFLKSFENLTAFFLPILGTFTQILEQKGNMTTHEKGTGPLSPKKKSLNRSP